MLTTVSPTVIEREFLDMSWPTDHSRAVATLPRHEARGYEPPQIDLGAREIEADEFGPFALIPAVIAVVAVVAVVAMVTDTHFQSEISIGPVGWSFEIN